MDIEKMLFEYQKDKSNVKLRNQIVENCDRFVKIAININGLHDKNHHNYEELLQEGRLRLIRAVERFDPYRGVKFSTYAIKFL